MPPYNLKSFNKGQQKFFQEIKKRKKRIDKINRILDRAIAKNDVFSVMNLIRSLQNEIDSSIRNAQFEADKIIKKLDEEYRKNPRRIVA